ncbi:hypothetical protein P9112_014015 [Eukaryota sp. TZLM1-RC]
MSIFTPSNQIKLTNVAVVRLKKSGKRFEIACYRNKVQSWRNGVESDIDEVLQTDSVFLNVSKGILASEKDLQKAFSTTDKLTICRKILEKGELQVSERERQIHHSNLLNQIAALVARRSVSDETKLPVSIGTIEQLMKDVHFSVNPSQSAKKQALEVFRLFQQNNIPVSRAKMRVLVSIPESAAKQLKSKVFDTWTVENQVFGFTVSLTMSLPPGDLHQLQDLVSQLSKGRGSVEVVELAAVDVSSADGLDE